MTAHIQWRGYLMTANIQWRGYPMTSHTGLRGYPKDIDGKIDSFYLLLSERKDVWHPKFSLNEATYAVMNIIQIRIGPTNSYWKISYKLIFHNMNGTIYNIVYNKTIKFYNVWLVV